MTDSITGYSFSGSQMARDLLNFSGMSGTSITVKGIIWSYGYQVKFTADSDLGFNVFVYGGRVYRLTSTNTVRENIFEFVGDADILSSVYLAGGLISIDTTRHASPARCTHREWGGEQVVTKQSIFNLTASEGCKWVFVSITSTHNTLLDVNGNLLRYVIPIPVGDSTSTQWLDSTFAVDDGYYPPLSVIIYGIEDATGLDADSIIDISYSLISPYMFNPSTRCFQLGSTDVLPNCTHTYNEVAWKFYQIDEVDSDMDTLNISTNSASVIVSKDSDFSSYVPQDMSVIINGRKTLSLTEKDSYVLITILPFQGYNGIGYVISQEDNVTTVMASKLPWMGDAWVSYQIQKKGTDEAKMYYDTAKSVVSIGAGAVGSGATGGASAMSVPSSVAGLGDAYANQHYTEQYLKEIPYGNGAPYGDIGELYYHLRDNVPPAYVSITKYSGQPEYPIENGKNFGYPAFGYDTITYDGFYEGAIASLGTGTLTLNQDEINSVITKISRGVRT